MDHLDQCKDVCDDFGTNTILSPHVVKEMGLDKVAGFTVKSYRSEGAVGTLPSDGEYKFGYDPMWDNDEEWDQVEEEIQAELNEDGVSEVVDNVPQDDEEIVDTTKNWVRDFCVFGIGTCLC